MARGGLAVDVQHHLAHAGLALCFHVHQFRQATQRSSDLRCPLAQWRGIGRQQLELVLAAAAGAFQADVLVHPQIEVAPRQLGQARTQAVDHLLAGDTAFGQRLHLDHDEGVVDPVAATDIPDDVLDGRVGQQQFAVGIDLRLHRLEGQAVIATREAAQLCGVLLRNDALGYLLEQPRIECDHCHEGQQWPAQLPQAGLQGAQIGATHALEQRIAAALPARGLLCVIDEQARTQHRHQAECHQHRHRHRRHQRQREFAEQALDEIVQEQDRDEHHGQRQVHRQQRSAHFRCTAHRRLPAVSTQLAMARDVFQHHDGVIHHQYRRHDQGHQREGIEREAHQRDQRQRAEQHHRNRHAGYQCRTPVAKEAEHHQYHQRDRQQQGHFCFVQGGADHR
ncbi:hypothetical protein D3C72_946680 [compost metagenome]